MSWPRKDVLVQFGGSHPPMLIICNYHMSANVTKTVTQAGTQCDPVLITHGLWPQDSSLSFGVMRLITCYKP